MDTKTSEGRYKNTIEDINKEQPAMLAELCFTILPFLILLIVNLAKSEPSRLLQTADWALAAAILYGQTAVKLGMGLAAQEHSFNHQYFGLIFSILIVFGLVPSIVVVVIFALNGILPCWLIIMQFILFAFAIYSYLKFGAIGQMLSSTAFKNKIAKILGLSAKRDGE